MVLFPQTTPLYTFFGVSKRHPILKVAEEYSGKNCRRSLPLIIEWQIKGLPLIIFCLFYLNKN